MIMSLIYSSRCLLDHTTSEFEYGIESIRVAADRNNRVFDITGFMFFFDNKFVQIIEGDFDNVTNLYKNIRRDPRHETCRLVEFCEVPFHTFSSASMISSIEFIRNNSAELHIKMKFLNKFIGENGQTSIKIRDLLLSIAQELQRKPHFPKFDYNFELENSGYPQRPPGIVLS